jgi:hypothetical protein
MSDLELGPMRQGRRSSAVPHIKGNGVVITVVNAAAFFVSFLPITQFGTIANAVDISRTSKFLIGASTSVGLLLTQIYMGKAVNNKSGGVKEARSLLFLGSLGSGFLCFIAYYDKLNKGMDTAAISMCLVAGVLAGAAGGNFQLIVPSMLFNKAKNYVKVQTAHLVVGFLAISASQSSLQLLLSKYSLKVALYIFFVAQSLAAISVGMLLKPPPQTQLLQQGFSPDQIKNILTDKGLVMPSSDSELVTVSQLLGDIRGKLLSVGDALWFGCYISTTQVFGIILHDVLGFDKASATLINAAGGIGYALARILSAFVIRVKHCRGDKKDKQLILRGLYVSTVIVAGMMMCLSQISKGASVEVLVLVKFLLDAAFSFGLSSLAALLPQWSHCKNKEKYPRYDFATMNGITGFSGALAAPIFTLALTFLSAEFGGDIYKEYFLLNSILTIGFSVAMFVFNKRLDENREGSGRCHDDAIEKSASQVRLVS